MPRTIVLAGGGTGGHVYPALAIGDALRARGQDLLYYGDPTRLEGRVVEKRGYPLRPVRAMGYPRAGILGKVVFAVTLAREVIKAAMKLRSDGVQAVIGFGGYVSAPTILAAWLLRIPRAIHESNVTPGLANKLCARVADLVLVTYPQSIHRVPGKAHKEVVGCPVNPRVLEGNRSKALERYDLSAEKPVVLFVGGSLGAARINDLAVAAARQGSRDFQIVQITGPAYLADVRSALGGQPASVALVGYEHHMADAYAASDLVVCRAGSSTLAELTVLGKPSVLIPSPNVTDNHQEANARGMEQAGAALVFTEAELTTSRFLEMVSNLVGDRASLRLMSEAASRLGKADSAEHAAHIIDVLLLSSKSR